MSVFKPIILIAIICLSAVKIKAQDSIQTEPLILLTGKVRCINPVNGALSSVLVFNISQGYGIMSSEDGSFSINMARKDSVVFSTAEHKDYYYSIKSEEAFEDKTIEVIMITDVVWLDVVTILGHQSLEQFKSEILSLDIPPGNRDLALPIINKYAKQLHTGDGETDLVGPLTYLQNKFDRYYKMRRQLSNDINRK